MNNNVPVKIKAGFLSALKELASCQTWVTALKLSELTGQCTSQVRRQMERLEALGYVSIAIDPMVARYVYRITHAGCVASNGIPSPQRPRKVNPITVHGPNSVFDLANHL